MNKNLFMMGIIASCVAYAHPSFAFTTSDASYVGYALAGKVCEVIWKGRAVSQMDALNQALELIYSSTQQELVLIVGIQEKQGMNHPIVETFRERFLETIFSNCAQEFGDLPEETTAPSIDNTRYSSTNKTCGSKANTFGSTVYVVYLSPERRGEAKNYGCNDALMVTINDKQWLQLASFNNEQDAKELAEAAYGWYAKKTINVSRK